ncbi:MAG: hypothetical protein AVDCRST_MAG13-718, partial [uncultured Solirubrobacteraceae bacterium]
GGLPGARGRPVPARSVAGRPADQAQEPRDRRDARRDLAPHAVRRTTAGPV